MPPLTQRIKELQPNTGIDFSLPLAERLRTAKSSHQMVEQKQSVTASPFERVKETAKGLYESPLGAGLRKTVAGFSTPKGQIETAMNFAGGGTVKASKKVAEITKKIATGLKDELMNLVKTSSNQMDNLEIFETIAKLDEPIEKISSKVIREAEALKNRYMEKFQPTIEKRKLEVKSTSDISEPLAQEAKKYKSAEEFVKAQPTYYHSTSADAAKSIEQGGFKAQIGERSLGVANAKGIWLYEDAGATTEFGKNFTRVGKTPAVVETKVNGKIFDATSEDRSIRAIVEDKALLAKLRNEGYVGVKGDELGTSATFVFDETALKTKSQLTDFYNKVMKK